MTLCSRKPLPQFVYWWAWRGHGRRHVKARGAFIERDHPLAGPTKLVAPWIRLSETPASIRADAPALGQRTHR
jgi:crotonobetainyl-CoA:carnitine CoA-transferase CaiB-like acyl-CoA transferase